MSLKVFVSTTSFGKDDFGPVELLKRHGIETHFNLFGRTLNEEEVPRLLDGYVGIIAGTERYTKETLSQAKNLKVVSRCGASVDGIDLEGARSQGIVIASTPFGPTQAVAELTLAFVLNLVRNVGVSDKNLRRERWEKPMGYLISELNIGIIGLGKIGKRVAELLRALGATLAGCDIVPDHAWAEKNNIAIKSREKILRESDMVSIHLSYDKALYHCVGERELGMMRKGSFLVNTSRGELVDEEALLRALRSGALRAAAIDTFEKEPYSGPLCALDNVILTPHIGSYAKAARIKMEYEAAENLIRELGRLKLLKEPHEVAEAAL